MLRYFLIGFVGGVVVSVLYILFGSWSWFSPTTQWARILFAPGLFTGSQAYELWLRHVFNFDLALPAAEGVGVATMGLVFGGLVSLLRIGQEGGK